MPVSFNLCNRDSDLHRADLDLLPCYLVVNLELDTKDGLHAVHLKHTKGRATSSKVLHVCKESAEYGSHVHIQQAHSLTKETL
jgi:hypothetical protein